MYELQSTYHYNRLLKLPTWPTITRDAEKLIKLFKCPYTQAVNWLQPICMAINSFA